MTYDRAVLVGDVHLRASVPASRIDDFVVAQERKVRAIVELANAHEAPTIITGDLFDRPDSPYALTNRYIGILAQAKHPILVAPGNHDVYGGALATLTRSALGNLVAAGIVQLLGPEPWSFEGPTGRVDVFGTSYMHRECPQPSATAAMNVLVAHEMIVQDPLYREQEEFVPLDQLAAQRPGWTLIVCGHYHYRFQAFVGGTHVINPGAVVRVKASVGDMALTPAVYLWGLRSNAFTLHELPHEPAAKVFHPVVCQAGKSTEPELVQALVAQLKDRNQHRVSLSEVAHQVMEERGTEPAVRECVLAALADAEAGYGVGRKL